MWSRARLDVGWDDLLSAALSSVRPAQTTARQVAARWDPSGEAAVFLTVRTAWDVLLTELALPPGEALVTAVNIPDMFELLEHHGLEPQPVDLDPSTLAPEPGALRDAIGERTRLVLVTHLLGTRVDMDTVHAELDAAGIGLPVIEDCAQSFEGPHEHGHPRSLAALFSFGPIKTQTALGGCLARVSDDALRRRMLSRSRGYPQQRRRDYLAVVAQYAVLKALTAPSAYASFVRACELAGRSHDEIINGAVLGLRGEDYWAALRRQPCAPLLAVLERRLARFDPDTIERRRQNGERLAERVGARVQVLGIDAEHRGWWQFALLSDEPSELITRLRAAGFDATAGASRLRCPEAEAARTPRASAAMRSIVYVPAYADLPPVELERLADLLLAWV